MWKYRENIIKIILFVILLYLAKEIYEYFFTTYIVIHK